MRTVLVERVLLAQLEQGGLSRDDICLLVLARRRGSTTATRILCTAAKATVNTTIDNPLTLAGLPDPHWNAEMVEIATLAIGGHLGWRAGRLYDSCGVIPATLATAAIGRPIGSVVAHPDIDPTRLSYMPIAQEGIAILQVTPEYGSVSV